MIIDKAKIIRNIEIAEGIWQMDFYSTEIANDYIGAGQFVSILANSSWEHPIRRPMSIAGVSGEEIAIIYKIFGSVTTDLTMLKPNGYLDVLGPIGNIFTLNNNQYHPILIGGGIGLSPIFNLANYLDEQGNAKTVIIGARTSSEHFIKHDPAKNIFLATDDGSIGITGTVIDALNDIINKIDNPKIFTCGPEPMLSALQKYLIELDIPGQFSVESYMACGVGFCQGCVIENRQNQKYHLVCKDGPVFEVNEVKFD